MALSAKEAAALVGMTKQGIIRAIHKGKLSATRNDNGEFVIDPAELFRVYKPVSTGVKPEDEVTDNVTPDQSNSLQVKVEMLEQRLRDKDDVIQDLRSRLDAEADERRKLTLMLVDKQQPQPGWWQRIFQRG